MNSNYTLEKPKFNSDTINNSAAQISENARIVSIGDTKVPELGKEVAVQTQNPTSMFVPPVQTETQTESMNPSSFGIPPKMVSDVQTYMGNENMGASEMQSSISNVPVEPVQTPAMPEAPIMGTPYMQNVHPEMSMPVMPPEQGMNSSQPELAPHEQSEYVSALDSFSKQESEKVDTTPRIDPLVNPMYNSVPMPGVELEQPAFSTFNQPEVDRTEPVVPISPIESAPSINSEMVSAPQTLEATPVQPTTMDTTLPFEPIAPRSPSTSDVIYESAAPVLDSQAPVLSSENDDELKSMLESVKKDAKDLLAKIEIIENKINNNKLNIGYIKDSEPGMKPISETPNNGVMPQTPTQSYPASEQMPTLGM